MYGGLRGKRILITRPRAQGGRLEEAIATLGGEVLWIPAIETVAVPPDEAGWSALKDLGRFGWVAFTSENALRFFLLHLQSAAITLPKGLRVASVGASTSRSCQEAGMTVTAQPKVFTGAELGRHLAAEFRPASLLLPRGASGRDDLADVLRAAGWDVVPVTCYRTQPAPMTSEHIWQIEQGVDAAVFASPSAVTALWDAIPETARDALRRAYCLPIGPSTAQALSSVGLSPGALPEESTVDGLMGALTLHFSGG